MIKLNGRTITPTVFPDHSSQVWKVPEECFHVPGNVITWEFENEAEFLHVAQLKDLIHSVVGYGEVILDLPYLPYARQDKEVSNKSTFALHTFARLLNSLEFTKVVVFDAHNYSLSYELINCLDIVIPDIEPLAKELNATVVYPDSGAGTRYQDSSVGDVIICEKERDPLTGEIKGLLINDNIEAGTYLIADDICDGGRTFIEVAKKLYKFGATEVHLYVSHGIFSKGLQVLRDAGIKRIFTRKGEVHEQRLFASDTTV